MPEPQSVNQPVIARRYTLCGHVQGVGFRPFVYHLAQQHGIHGWVENGMGQVIIHAEGIEPSLDVFLQDILELAPAASRPVLHKTDDLAAEAFTHFTIRQSNPDAAIDVRIVADLPLCDQCRTELFDSTDRRFRYPFINCTHCGPRYSFIRRLPYDRQHTTMATFTLCDACSKEYHDSADRRFHAEPVACEKCGPTLSYSDVSRQLQGNEQALQQGIAALRAGSIIAVKGVGGYHLMCDARNVEAVNRLRQRKMRPHKPLAVMLPESQLDAYVECDHTAHALLQSRIHPIVLLAKRKDSVLAENLAPGLNEIGVLLPYSPLHELLLHDFAAPLVATSANISGEPVLTDNDEVMQRLGHVADGFLHHDRAIQRPVDDPVYRIIDNKPRPLRTGRGNAPLELTLPFRLDQPVLATGGHMKNTIALAWDDRIVISPHIGDLNAARSLDVFQQTIADLQRLYHVTPQQMICDTHSGYASSRWAKQSELPITAVYHHHAHAAVLCGEYPDVDRWLVFTWDGAGLGPDGTLWGGEALLGNAGDWQHVASMRPFRLPGGDKAARDPWRCALALCWETDTDWQIDIEHIEVLQHAWQQKINSPQTSAVGRLFDAAAAFLQLLEKASFEGQGPMLLEALAGKVQTDAIELPLTLDTQGIWRSDWSVLLAMLLDNSLSRAARAACLHESIAHALVRQARRLRKQHGSFHVGLCGGVFQNRVLTERVVKLLTESGFQHAIPEQLPVNDAGLCFGQVIEAMMRRERKHTA